MAKEKNTSLKENPKVRITPGDLRKNKGFLYLRDEYIPLFRQPYFPGILESFTSVLLFRLIAGFKNTWCLSEAVFVLWLVLIPKFFTTNPKHYSLLTTVLSTAGKLSELLLLAYLALLYVRQ